MPQSSIRKPAFALLLIAPVFGAGLILPPSPSVTVHEWGTFTSIAGPEGQSVPWVPLEASSDLPCFVHRMGTGVFKYVMPGLVRMETPVDYFYTDSATKVSVNVDFPGSLITEWYPKATQSKTYAGIEWKDLQILPGTTPTLPSTVGASRYFAARATDSAPVQASDENEKLLFYRGIGNFRTPLEPVLEGNGIRIHNSGMETIPLAILFDNEGGHIGYRVARNISKEDVELYTPDLNATLQGMGAELTADLERAGLYPKEAAAMLETWHDSWFEEGTRVIYLMPRAEVDKILPLQVSPAPRDVQRVFVGRAEILSPWTNRTIRKAMETNDRNTLEKFDRFLPTFLARIRTRGGITESPLAASWVDSLAARRGNDPAPCVH